MALALSWLARKGRAGAPTTIKQAVRALRFAGCYLGVALCGCGRYADFALPKPEAAGPRGLAASAPLKGAPVLERGARGEWDSVDVLNPSMVRFRGALWNFYSGFDGHTWRTGAAVEENGAWRKLGMVLQPEGWEGGYIAANGSALVEGDEILYWYVAGEPPRIALARSRDGRAWNKQPSAVVPLGPRGSFDERGVADPYVIRAGNRYYLFYLGQDRARRQRLGVARSADGVVWEKLRSNPVMEVGEPGAFDENGLGEPAVWTSGGAWWMLYTGRDRGERRRIGLARSGDGVHWEREANFKPLAGAEAWNSQVVCDPHVELLGDGRLRVWYGGGDVARPAENLDGQIGVVELRVN
jgi:predicted GH43/DUF377 family glycosyl hydrolase